MNNVYLQPLCVNLGLILKNFISARWPIERASQKLYSHHLSEFLQFWPVHKSEPHMVA